ncbi:MAG: choice-of-anchor X domain-containing protein [Deltaproteobacteria bacterium]|nr:choice-of-anchor X domain-containing protein [Deltaproteobacteria bacterium]
MKITVQRIVLFTATLSSTGCGLEACGTFGNFEATPEAEATIEGKITDIPDELRSRAQGRTLTARAISVDGAVLGESDARIDETFTLALGEGLDHFNVRVVVEGGSFVAKDFVAEAPAGSESKRNEMGIATTAAAQVVERYAVRERASLASTPTVTLQAVLQNALGRGAAGDEDRVSAFRDLVADVFAVLDPAAGDPGFDRSSSDADEGVLATAGIEASAYDAALEAAVDAALVPIVCDPSQVNVLFAVDASGQGKDGNGAPQFIRQPPKEGKVFLGITLDPTSPVPDSAGTLRPRLTPNDPQTEMRDDGSNGDEVAGDGIFSAVLGLPRGMRVLYKYTDGSPNEGFTGTEEWPGNARILQVEDVMTSSSSGTPDCLVIRRDSFGDESSNKNFVNLNARLGGGDLGYSDDLGGDAFVPPAEGTQLPNAGLAVVDVRTKAPLTPAGIPEARENGVCSVCPAPLTVSADDDQSPRLVAASFLGVDQTRVIFSEDVDVQSGGLASNFLLVDDDNDAVPVVSVQVVGSQVTLTHQRVDPRAGHRVSVKDVTDASLQQNPIEGTASVVVGPDRTPPVVVDVRGGSIVEVNPSSRPADPATGEVFVVTFSEELDRIAAENAANYSIDGLAVFAAFQRGREVFVVTEAQERGRTYTLGVKGAFDVAGNVVKKADVDARALSLSLVTFRAIVDFAWLSIDGTTKGLPPGKDLYLTGTALRDARGVDGRDLRVFGRTDVAGREGFRFERQEGGADDGVYSLTVRMPAGAYAFKLAYGDLEDSIDPPVTLESVSKGLATRNDLGGVAVDPVTLTGRDGTSYAGARISTNGADLPGPGVIFKRENPDGVVVVGEVDRVLDPEIIGTWRDVPFGQGADYDDGLIELPNFLSGAVDDDAPRLLAARARDSESALLSFDEAIVVEGTLNVAVADDTGAALPVVETVVGQPLSTQLVVRIGSMQNDTAYAVVVSGLKDTRGNALPGPLTAGFTSPAFFQPFQPLVDDLPPALSSVRPTSPTEIEVVFSERLNESTVTLADFSISGTAAPTVSAVRVLGGGLRALLTTTTQTRQADYTLTVEDIDDVAGNTLSSASVPFPGFGEFDPPEVERVFALSPTSVAVLWNEPITADSAARLSSYLLTEVTITSIRFGASDDLRGAAFNTNFAPLSADVVVLTTTPMTGGGTYTLAIEGVADLSGNESLVAVDFTAVAVAPTVDVLLTYLISDSVGVVGVGAGGAAAPPARAISAATLSQQREGVFALGTALSNDGVTELASHPFTSALSGFPDDGAPLTGVEPELKDDGTGGDRTSRDNIYTLRISDVPVGSTLSWKAFASFTTAFGGANPQVPGASFADATRGPSAFGDGQEYPGNDNAVFVIGDDDGDGVVTIECLFGDEITFKRKTGFPAFHMAIGRARRVE